jgi:hypothetical protein
MKCESPEVGTQRDWSKINAIATIAFGASTMIFLLLNHRPLVTVSLMSVTRLILAAFAAVMTVLAVLQYKAVAMKAGAAAGAALRVTTAELISEAAAETFPIKIYTEILNNSDT